MVIYVLRRLLLGLSVLLAAAAATFVIFFMGPSDPAGVICGDRNCTPERYAQIQHDLGLDKPKTEQFAGYLKGLVVGTKQGVRDCEAPCLGWSYVQNRPVRDMVVQALPVTVSIVLGGMVVYSLLGLLFGVLAARERGSPFDRSLVGLSQGVTALPYFVIAQIAYLYLMVYVTVLPRAKWTPLTENPWQWLVGLIGVWLVFGVVQSATYIRYVRAAMIDVQSQDYVRTARSKGISERDVVVRHALRAAIGPFLTLVGLNVALELQGTIFTERIFGLQGMGWLAVSSFSSGDLPVIAGVVLVGAFFIVVLNLLVDLLYGLVDPRVKLA